VNHRHLLPNEIDLLLDGDVGFGVAPLRAHVAECARCAAEVEGARVVVEALDHIPRFSPSPLFAERVMARTQVFEPWHAALLSWVRGMLPAARAGRLIVAGTAASIAVGLTLASIWLATQMDAVLFIGQMVLDRARNAFVAGLDTTFTSIVGDAGAGALRASGGIGIALTAGAAVLAGALAVGALRAAISASKRAR
jgi:hypothetical protein